MQLASVEKGLAHVSNNRKEGMSKQVAAIKAVLNALQREGVAENVRFRGCIGKSGHKQTLRAEVAYNPPTKAFRCRRVFTEIVKVLAKAHGNLTGEVIGTIDGKETKISL